MPSARVEVARRRATAGRRGDLPARRQPRRAGSAPGQGGFGGRAGPHHAGLRLALTDAPPAPGLRRGRRRRRRRGGDRGGRRAGRAGPPPQVLVVTHLAQVAAPGRPPVEVRKAETAGRTRTEVRRARRRGPGGRAGSDALGTPDSATARRHAEELLASRVGRSG